LADSLLALVAGAGNVSSHPFIDFGYKVIVNALNAKSVVASIDRKFFIPFNIIATNLASKGRLFLLVLLVLSKL
jgi:hypothetical protein